MLHDSCSVNCVRATNELDSKTQHCVRRRTRAGMSGVLPVTVIRPSDGYSGNEAALAASAAPSTPAGAGAATTTPVLSNGGELANGGDLAPTPQKQRRMLHTRRVKSAVIVAAGLSTRMFPASAVVKKELFPIVDHDGVCKPVILAIMEGLVESGIERIVVVVQEKDIPVFDAFFSMKAVEKHKHRYFRCLWPIVAGCVATFCFILLVVKPQQP